MATDLSDFEFWRRAHFTAEQLTNATFSGDAADPDQDGMSNWKEYVALTDPTNGASVFGITVGTNTPYVRVQFVPSAADRLYTLQWCMNLADGVWRTVPGQVRVAGSTTRIEPLAPNQSRPSGATAIDVVPCSAPGSPACQLSPPSSER